MKDEQRKKAQPYHKTVEQRFPNASHKMIKRLIAIQQGKERP